jgi:hypothetical protein
VLSDVQLQIYKAEGNNFQPVGFGVTKLDGSFALFEPGARGPLWLMPGTYRCTLQSIGAPVAFPKEYQNPETTPLTFTWTSDRKQLHLVAPELP